MADIKNSDPQIMHDISKEIKRYAETVKSDVQKLVNKHRNIGGSWSGEQYDRFTEIVESVKKNLDTQAERLCEIAAEVDKDSVALAEALGVTLRG